jgi:DNA-binding SARP family transcriptional activator
VKQEVQSKLKVRMFGPIAVQAGSRSLGPRDFSGVKPKQVLEILLAARGEPVPKDRLADLLWDEKLPRNVSKSLETYVSVLRHRLADIGPWRALVVTLPDAYRFAVEDADVDLDRFDELVERAAHARPPAARRYLERALALVEGDLLADEPYASWAEDLRNTNDHRLQQVRLDAAEAAGAQADYRSALAHAEAVISADRFNEQGYRLVMLALYALGRQHDALEAFQRCRLALVEELGVEPMKETKSLHNAILRHANPRTLLPGVARGSAPPPTDLGAPGFPFLGRTEELSELERFVHAARTGASVLVFVEGEAGIGKSRLLAELVPRLDGMRVGWTRCSQLERELPYVPLAMALRRALGDASLDPESLPALGEIMPELRIAEPDQARPQLAALESLVELVNRLAPVVLVIDDLHWADASTIAALGYLQRRCEDTALALIAAFRPEEVRPEDSLSRLDPTARIELAPLSEADVALLGAPELYAQTGGHPSFIVAAMTDPQDGAMPRALLELVVARCRAEGPDEFRALVAAALLRQPFAPEALARILDADPVELVDLLERLCERRLLRIDGKGFRFRYDVIRAGLRESVSPARRRLLQQRVREAVES